MEYVCSGCIVAKQMYPLTIATPLLTLSIAFLFPTVPPWTWMILRRTLVASTLNVGNGTGSSTAKKGITYHKHYQSVEPVLDQRLANTPTNFFAYTLSQISTVIWHHYDAAKWYEKQCEMCSHVNNKHGGWCTLGVRNTTKPDHIPCRKHVHPGIWQWKSILVQTGI